MRFCHSASCFSVSSLVMPYVSWILPIRLSRLPAITSSWSSVSLPHCSLALPLNCFQLPSMRSQFMFVSLRLIERRNRSRSRRQGKTYLMRLRRRPRQFGALARIGRVYSASSASLGRMACIELRRLRPRTRRCTPPERRGGGSVTASPAPRGRIERHHGRQLHLDLLRAVRVRRVRAGKAKGPFQNVRNGPPVWIEGNPPLTGPT